MKIPELKIGNLSVKLPIVQGGMGVGVSLSGLASSVTNNGGLGIISSVGIGMLEKYGGHGAKEANIEGLREEIRRAKNLTSGVLGVNIMTALSDFGEMLKTAIQEQVDIIFIGAGLITRFPENIDLNVFKSASSLFAPIVSSSRAMEITFRFWDKHYNHVPDAVVVEGPLAGGHLGFKKINLPTEKLEDILSKVVNGLKKYEEKYKKSIPVIAGGGINDGFDIAKLLKLGASAVQMGSRFVATEECDASPEFKKAFVDTQKEDIVIIDSPVGLPGRAIDCEYLKQVRDGERKPISCLWKCLKTCDYKKAPYCIARALTNAQQGNLKEGFAFCGANAYKIKEITKVKDLLNKIKEDILFSLDK